MTNQKVTIEYTDDDQTQNGNNNLDLLDAYSKLYRLVELAVGGFKETLNMLRRMGRGEQLHAKGIENFLGMAANALEEAKVFMQPLPIIPQKEQTPGTKWEVQMQLYVNGLASDKILTREVESLEDAAKWNSDMLAMCEESAKAEGWDVLERGFDKHTGSGFLRHRAHGDGFQTRFRVLKNGEIYTGE